MSDYSSSAAMSFEPPAASELMITLTTFPDVSAQQCREGSQTWEDLVKHIRGSKRFPSKQSCPLIKLARFGTQKTDKGSLRHDSNLLEVTGVEGDYDGEKLSINDAAMLLANAGITAVLYTSPSHTADKPRWRVLAPLSHPYPPGDRARLLARVNGAMGGILGPESFVLSQSFYIGKVKDNYDTRRVNGRCVDLLDNLDKTAILPAAKSGEPKAERLQQVRSQDPTIQRLTERGLVKRQRSDGGVDIVCPFEAEHTGPGGGGDTTYFPPHTGGYVRGHFKCLHAHCAERTDDEFLQTVGLTADGSKEQSREKSPAMRLVNKTFPPADVLSSAEIVCLADVAPEPITWLWDQRIALGKLTLIAGDPDLGKSLVTLGIAAAVTTGARWPVSGGNATRGEVILLSAEDDIADTIRPRMDAAGGDVNKIHVLKMIRDIDPLTGKVTRRGFSLRRDIPALEEVLAGHPDSRLVIIDPISAYLDGTDSHTNAAVRGLLAPMSELAAKFKAAIVAVSHLNKSSGQTSAMYRITASLAFVAAARAVYAVIKDKDDEGRRLVLPVKNNLSPDRTGLAYRIGTAENAAPRIEWENAPVMITADEAMSSPDDSEDQAPAVDEAESWLTETLKDRDWLDGKELKTLAKDSKISERTLYRAAGRKGVKMLPGGFGKARRWHMCAMSAKECHVCQSFLAGTHEELGTHGSKEQPSGPVKSMEEVAVIEDEINGGEVL